MSPIKSKVNQKTDYVSEQLRASEQRINFIYTLLMIAFVVAIMSYNLLNDWDDFRYEFSVPPIIAMTVCIVLNIVFRKQCYTWIKYVNNAVVMCSIYMMCGCSIIISMIFLLIPFLNSFYYRPWLTVISSVLCLFLLYVSNIIIAFPILDESGALNYSMFTMIPETFDFAEETVVLLFKNRSFVFIVGAAVMMVSIYLSIGGRRYAVRQGKLIEASISHRAELSTAKNIQEGILSTNFPDNDVYAVCADMTPAAQVGGDFYDYFTVDDTRIAVVIGDVSGHGMPAALFMTLTKTLFKVYAQAGYPTDKVMEHVNRYLQESNPEKFFVTGWIGILDLSTGILSFTDAGHNYPILIRANGEVDYLKSLPNFVLGRRRRVKYIEEQIKLSIGDKLLLYTDGVTEAQSPKEAFFGDERLLGIARKAKQQDQAELVHTIRAAVDSFENGNGHYDDATILTLYFKEYLRVEPMKSETFFLNKQSFDTVLSYIGSCCQEAGCDEETVGQITIASSEILANIDSYAYENGGDITIKTKCHDQTMTIVFIDNGKKFDPLQEKAPDVTLPLKERRRGGLGIFIVKKLMTDISYQYVEHQNVLTITKDL
nr:SpoIIE family protein phosphatase [uncultured Ruminococcus sp.]